VNRTGRTPELSFKKKVLYQKLCDQPAISFTRYSLLGGIPAHKIKIHYTSYYILNIFIIIESGAPHRKESCISVRKKVITKSEMTQYNSTQKYEFDVEGMTCAACVSNVENALSSVPGVKEVTVNLATDSARIMSDQPLSISQLTQAVTRAGYELEPKGTTSLLEKQQRRISSWQQLLLIQALFGIPLLSYAMIEMFTSGHLLDVGPSILFQFILASVLVISGAGYYRRGFRHLLVGAPNMDSLVALGTGSAYVYSVIAAINMYFHVGISGFEALYFEAAGTILLFITFGKWLEAKARGKTTEALSGLLDEMPEEAEVFRDDKWIKLALDQVKVDDLIRVKPHQKIPVDGLIISGSTSVDESAISGESLPVDKHVGSYVVAASMNLQSSFEMHAKKIGRESMFGQIIQLVENAQAKKPTIQKRVDRISAIFVPIVLILAVLSAVIWMFLGYGLTFAISIFVSVLIIACPCALGLATPTALVVASGIAAGRGILFKTPDAFETLAGIEHLMLDKTGTLTKGQARLVEYYPEEVSRIIPLAKGLSESSEHPLSIAIKKFGSELNLDPLPISEVTELPGAGLSGMYEGQIVSLQRLSEDLDLTDELQEAAHSLNEKAYSISALLRNGEVIGLLGFSDELKEEAPAVVDYFHQQEIETLLITGDRQKIADQVGDQLRLSRILAEIHPIDKHAEVQRVQQEGKIVAMVGDGINDAPALVQANLGISISSGTDIAINAAEIIFLRSSLMNLVYAHRIARSTVRKISQNLFWAFIYNSVGIPIAMGLLYPLTGTLLNPMFAGLAMALSSVSVVGNTLLLRAGNYFRSPK